MELAIKQPKLILVTVDHDSTFPSALGASKGMQWLSHSLTTVSIPGPNIIIKKEHSREGGIKNKKMCFEEKERRYRKKREARFSYLGRRKASKGGAYSMHDGGMLMQSMLRQALGQGIGDIKGTPILV